MLAATANPEHPNEVQVSRPSDALAAKQATDKAFTGLLLGLGAVALLVGGVGVANTMVISVLERRAEIGLRRSLGATRGQIRLQFLVESLLLSALGGIGGVLLGIGGHVGLRGDPGLAVGRAGVGHARRRRRRPWSSARSPASTRRSGPAACPRPKPSPPPSPSR